MKDDLLKIDPKVTRLVLVNFLRNEIIKLGIRRAVLNVAAGMEAALACYLVVEALGPENVTAFYISAADSISAGTAQRRLVEEAFVISVHTVDVDPLVQRITEGVGALTADRQRDAEARASMAILHDRARALDALVIGCSNKSDLLLGLGAIYGDLASAINPLGDLYRTQIRQLITHLPVLADFIAVGAAGDYVGAHLGRPFLDRTYAEVDPLLHLLFDERYSPDEAADAGFDRGIVNEVLTFFHRSHAQRVMPLIPKLSGRTVGHDLMYLRDSHIYDASAS